MFAAQGHHLSQPTEAYILALANSFGGSLIIIGSVSQYHCGSAGARIGNQNFLLGFCPIGHSSDTGRAGRTHRLDVLIALTEKCRRALLPSTHLAKRYVADVNKLLIGLLGTLLVTNQHGGQQCHSAKHRHPDFDHEFQMRQRKQNWIS